MPCVYLLSSPGRDGLIKIGRSSRPAHVRAREASAQTPPSQRLRVELALMTPQAVLLELLVHRRLAHVRIRGSEWFKVDTATAVEAIEQTALAHGIELAPGG